MGLWISGGNGHSTISSNRHRHSLTRNNVRNINISLTAVHTGLQLRSLVLQQPARSSLLDAGNRGSLCCLGTISQVIGDGLSISGTDVGQVGSLTAALQLRGEHRNGDGDQNGRSRI